MLKIGSYQLDTPVLLAPMSGITDLPFRHAVRQFGVGMAVAEMVSSKPTLQRSHKSHLRRVSLDEPLPRAIQIVGNDAKEMASAAALNEDKGAGLIDINMGCPAKKVCRKAAGSALLADETQVQAIIEAVVAAVSVPVTLKIRTGIAKTSNNALQIAHIAEQSGIQSLVVHGRSRACMFNGVAEHETISRVKQAVSIPVIANGDICSAKQARKIMRETGADGVMIGRAAQGQPWLPSIIGDALVSKLGCVQPDIESQKNVVLEHIRHIHEYYGETQGVKIARKHIRWYLQNFEGGQVLARHINQMQSAQQTLQALTRFYDDEIPSMQQSRLSAIAA
jgi:tRNA-dihydrouridine synthase B